NDRRTIDGMFTNAKDIMVSPGRSQNFKGSLIQSCGGTDCGHGDYITKNQEYGVPVRSTVFRRILYVTIITTLRRSRRTAIPLYD
ncbi:MAG: hypothetical protein JNM43_00065, partial [Planctomycetaceae bacterium]|nr:hypothetical protein [Planctomycetaceae bacterium]